MFSRLLTFDLKIHIIHQPGFAGRSWSFTQKWIEFQNNNILYIYIHIYIIFDLRKIENLANSWLLIHTTKHLDERVFWWLLMKIQPFFSAWHHQGGSTNLGVSKCLSVKSMGSMGRLHIYTYQRLQKGAGSMVSLQGDNSPSLRV